MPILYSECAPRNRCRNYRRCAPCAQIRQAQVADVAQRGAVFSPNLTYAVIKTTSPTTIGKDKAVLQKHLKSIADGGIWTVEQGSKTVGLHLNLLIGSTAEIPAPDIASGWPAGGEVWAQNVDRAEVRNVAAYIAKPESYPEKPDYAGHIYGSWGQWRSPLQVLAGQRAVPEMQAVALDYQLWQLGVSAPVGTVMPTPDDEALAAIEHEQAKALLAKRRKAKRFALVLAAAEGRIDVSGLAYVDGHGIKTRAEIQWMRGSNNADLLD